ncbi:MAG TPA: DUF6569 family protein [Blastocatellia bacterium]|jgi:hypothetical protein|nr:DUF6569 family protein [Blastocatellia bacterium]
MKALLRLAVGVLLTGLVSGLAMISVAGNNSNVEANGPNRTSPAPVNPKWSLGAPISFKNLTVFPVLGDSLDSNKYITLDEGLKSGKVIITEIGANGRARRIGQSRQASDDAEVNKLLLTNRSGKTLVLIAGEIVVGGKQDRIVGHDCLIASSNRRVPLDVFCIEPGRWNEESSFGRSQVQVAQTNAAPQSRRSRRGGRGIGVGRGSGSGMGSGSGAGVARGVAGGVPGGTPGGIIGVSPSFGLAATALAPPNVREKAQASKDQSKVWEEVAVTNSRNGVSSSTGNLNASLSSVEVKTKLDDYEAPFASILSNKRIVGVVVAVGGKLRAADVFATHSLFRSYWPRLLKSYGLEALSAPGSDSINISQLNAEEFLARSAGKKSVGARSRVYRLTEHQTDKDASFELTSGSNAVMEVIHFNRVSKQ